MNRKTFAATATALTLSAGMLLSGAALAEQDFSKYTNEEMVQMRSQVRTMNEADRAQFQAEMQKRTRTMSAAERQQLGLDGQETQMRQRVNEDNAQGKGDMDRDRQRLEDGSGSGQATQDKLRERVNEDNTTGKGDMERDRMRIENEGYGRGFGSRQGGGASGGGRGH